MTETAGEDLIQSLVFIAVFTLICTVLCMTFILDLCNLKHTQRSQRSQRIMIIAKFLVFACVLISTLCEWADLIRHIICYINNKNLYYYPLNNIMCFADFLHYFGAILFYIIAISRLQITFHGSQYAITCIIASFFYTLIGFSFILAVYYSIIVYLSPNNDNGYNDFWRKHDTIPMIMIGAIDLVLNTSLLTLFVTKLKQILEARLINSKRRGLINDERTDTESRNLLTLMTRHTVLFGLAIITNQIWYIVVLVTYHNHKTLNIGLSPFCFRSLQNTSNCIVLFLGLKRNINYYLFLCGCCHKKIEKCFMGNIQIKLSEVSNSLNVKIAPKPKGASQADLSTVHEETH